MMALALLAFVTQLAFVLFPGLVLHRALARRILNLDAGGANGKMDEVDLLGFGLLPGLALANTVGTVLAVFHVFDRSWYLAVMALIVVILWRDAMATILAIGEFARRSLSSLAHGDLMIVVAAAILVQTAAGMLVEALVPSGGVDIWNHNFPLARSIVDYHGFLMPQIGSMFYGSYPIFFHMFFAQALLLVDDVVAAKAANAMIYLSFLLSLLVFARHLRPVIVVLISVAIINAPFFSLGTADVMTDTTRVCFSTLAFVFAYRYLCLGRVYFLFAAGLLAGGAIAGKYTELLTPMLIGVSLLPALIGRRPGGWLAVGVFASATIVTGVYPYLRNLVLLHNPIYPFVFGHPGISDETMKGLQAEIFSSMDPTLRAYSQNLLSLAGWRDFAGAAQQVFLSQWKPAPWILAIIAAGLILLRSRALVCFGFWTLVMWTFWYTIGNMNYRWGLTAVMLLSIIALLVIMETIDRVADRINGSGNRWPAPGWLGAVPWQRKIPGWLTPGAAVRIAIAGWALIIGTAAIQRLTAEGPHAAFPRWLNHNLARAVLQPDGLDGYLANSLMGYKVYRYIGEHDLKMVFQPLDVGGYFFPAAYNGGKKGEWMVNPWFKLPQDPSQYSRFIQTNAMRYFVYTPSISPSLAQRLDEASNNPRYVESAYEFMRYLLPGSRLILTDPHGWELREIGPDKLT
jgi:hypothetical protein